MRAVAVALVVSALWVVAAPAAVLAQAARALGSPWGEGPAAPATSGEGARLDAELSGSDGGTAVAPGASSVAPSGGGSVGPGGVVVPDGYAPVVVPSPGLYPGAGPPRIVVDDALHLPSGIVTRLRALDADLQILAVRGGGSVLDGVLALLSGGLSIAIGVILEPSVSGSGVAGSGSLSPYLYTYGSGMVLRGILDLALMTNPGAAATTYAHMPMRTHREVRERLRYGEAQLGSLSEMAAITRYVDGGLNIGIGLLILPVYIAPNGFDETSPFTYLVLLGAAVSVTTGLIAIFTTSEAERRWGAYRELRDRLSAMPEGADDDSELDELAGDDADLASLARPMRPALTGRMGLGGLSLDGTF